MDFANAHEQLKNKRLLHIGGHVDSERGVYELRLQFDDGYWLEVVPHHFGLNITGGQEYVGPPRP